MTFKIRKLQTRNILNNNKKKNLIKLCKVSLQLRSISNDTKNNLSRNNATLCCEHNLHCYIVITVKQVLQNIHNSFILVINQLNAQNLVFIKVYYIPLHVSSTMCSKYVEAYTKLIIKQEFVH